MRNTRLVNCYLWYYQ